MCKKDYRELEAYRKLGKPEELLKRCKYNIEKGSDSMNETIKLWLTNLYEKEIEDVKRTMSNNHLCILSSSTKDDERMFVQNEMDMKEYLEVLEELKLGVT